MFCADPLRVQHFKDSVRDHDHMTGKFRRAAYNECNFKLKLNPKTASIPVIFRNLKDYVGHSLILFMHLFIYLYIYFADKFNINTLQTE